MQRFACALTSALLAPLMFDVATAQDLDGLEISVIGDLRALASDQARGAELLLEEVEFAFVGPLNPYASAEVFLAIHGTEGIEVEEAKLVLDRYLPGRLGLTTGVFLLDFGRLNTFHPHAYPFIRRPLMHSEFFSADGVRDMSIRLDWIAPPEAVTIRASAGLVRGDVFALPPEDVDEADDHAHGQSEGSPKIGFSGRLDLYAEPAEDVSFLVGASVLSGEFDPHESARVAWIGTDAKLAWDLGSNRQLEITAEAAFGDYDSTDELPAGSTPKGWFAAADLQTSRRWNLGGFAENTTSRLDDDLQVNRYGGFLGFALMEESTLFRVMGSSTDPDGSEREDELIVQAIFGLGPHRPHRY
ncbi:MAG: hypothetical protein DHS20C21_20630 [Gemmatimonadota bacterium]|nr:MAG: hypothetical protein DHS20C21_20630 [Gemmatimonadota bacterium]